MWLKIVGRCSAIVWETLYNLPHARSNLELIRGSSKGNIHVLYLASEYNRYTNQNLFTQLRVALDMLLANDLGDSV